MKKTKVKQATYCITISFHWLDIVDIIDNKKMVISGFIDDNIVKTKECWIGLTIDMFYSLLNDYLERTKDFNHGVGKKPDGTYAVKLFDIVNNPAPAPFSIVAREFFLESN